MRCKWVIAACAVAMLGLPNDGRVRADAPEGSFLIVKGAQDAHFYRRNPTSRQVSYTLDLTYPAQAIGEVEFQRLQAEGWARCRSIDPGVEEANKDWIHFEDATVTPSRMVHQHLTHWAKADQFIVVSMSYYSAKLESKPDNKTQHVDLIFGEAHGVEEAAWLELDCTP